MTKTAIGRILDRFPKLIPFPIIERRHRASQAGFAHVSSVEQLPGRLIFGDLIDNSFQSVDGGWQVRYRDAFDNGLDLSVKQGRFNATLRFLEKESISVGPLVPERAFPELLNLAAEQWNRVLKERLESLYPVTVSEPDPGRPHCMYIPDGWMKTILVPVAPQHLPELLRWHLALAEDPQLGASQTGSVTLAFNAVNYVEGRIPAELADPDRLAVESLLSTQTPLTCAVVRETGKDGSAAWTVRRLAYLYRLSAFLRDVPHLVDRLHQDGWLCGEPDQRAAIAPAELVLAASEMAWWSGRRECRITWAWQENTPQDVLKEGSAYWQQSLRQAEQAKEAACAFQKYLGLEEAIAEAESGRDMQ